MRWYLVSSIEAAGVMICSVLLAIKPHTITLWGLTVTKSIILGILATGFIAVIPINYIYEEKRKFAGIQITDIRPVGAILYDNQGRPITPAIFLYATVTPGKTGIWDLEVKIQSPKGEEWYGYIDGHARFRAGSIFSPENIHIARFSIKHCDWHTPMPEPPASVKRHASWIPEERDINSGTYKFTITGHAQGKPIEEERKKEINIKEILRRAKNKEIYQKKAKKSHPELVEEAISTIKGYLNEE